MTLPEFLSKCLAVSTLAIASLPAYGAACSGLPDHGKLLQALLSVDELNLTWRYDEVVLQSSRAPARNATRLRTTSNARHRGWLSCP